MPHAGSMEGENGNGIGLHSAATAATEKVIIDTDPGIGTHHPRHPPLPRFYADANCYGTATPSNA